MNITIYVSKITILQKSLLYCVRACDLTPNQTAGIFLLVFWYVIMLDIVFCTKGKANKPLPTNDLLK